jgi:hypothetical protein
VLIVMVAAATSPAAPPILPGYADYETYGRQIKALGAQPGVHLQSLGTTLGRREVYLLRIGTGSLDAKPAVLVVGGLHAPQLFHSELALRLAQRLVEGAKTDLAIQRLLAQVTFYVIPRPAPDASEAFFEKPYRERTGNLRPVDDDRDGRVDEDGPEDLNADGLITMMRVADPAGAYMPHPDDPRVLVQASRTANEQGRYRVYVEGRDRDGDEAYAEDGPGGVAFNRNFPFRYPTFQPDAGPYAVSEVETKAVADFAFGRTNIALVFTFTPQDNLVEPWKPDAQAESQPIKTRVLAADAPYFEHLGKLYRPMRDAKDPPAEPAGQGSFSEWAYFHYGRWSLACRAWWIPKVDAGKKVSQNPGPPASGPSPAKAAGSTAPKPDARGADELNALRWFAREKIDGFVPWKPIEHPDFPGQKVELGGFKPFVRSNPPAAALDGLAQQHLKFLTRTVELLPRLTLGQAKAEPLGGGVWRVKIQVVNHGYLPTMSKMGQVAHQVQPLQAQIELGSNLALVTGSPRTELPVLAGNGGQAEHAWLVTAHGTPPRAVRVRAWSPAVGEVVTNIELLRKP